MKAAANLPLLPCWRASHLSELLADWPCGRDAIPRLFPIPMTIYPKIIRIRQNIERREVTPS